MRLISEARYRKLLHGVFRLLGKKLVVININYMGLGNRLKMLAVYDVNFGLDDVTMYWNEHGWVPCRMADIVRIEGIRNFREIAIRETPWMVPVITHPSHDRFWGRGYWRFDVDGALPESWNLTRQGLTFPSIDFHYERTPQPYLDRYKAFFARVKPSAAVLARMQQVEVRESDVCVQVRITVDEKDRANVPRIGSYIERMRAFPECTRFFISTLDASVSAAFYQAFGDRILELPHKQYRSMVDATADMYLLSRGGTYLVSAGSTFGEVAWWLGGCRQQVMQVEAEVFA